VTSIGSRPLLETLKEIFAENEWGYAEADDEPVLISELTGPLGRWTLGAQVVEEGQLVLLFCICGVVPHEVTRSAMAVFLTRVNYGLSLGSFELDLDDGEIRYKTPLAVVDGRLDARLVERLIRACGRTMETFFPGIEAVAAGATPEEAMRPFTRPPRSGSSAPA
jgi:hypothetical protein